MSASVNKNGLLAGKVAVVTGASRGIGEAIARRYAMEGAKVVVCARTVEEGEHRFLPGSIKRLEQDILEAGGEALAIRCDLSEREDRENLIKGTEEAYGPVDILVNNAAVTWFEPFDVVSEKHYKVMMEVQVYGPFHLAQLVLPSMRDRKSGWILNISSHAAIHPPKAGGGAGTVYGMCKAALERFTTGLASETYDDNIGVNVISPGLVATPGVVHHKLVNESNKDRVTPAEHMAEACLRLCNGDAKEITGRIDYADQVIKEFNLKPADLIGELATVEEA